MRNQQRSSKSLSRGRGGTRTLAAVTLALISAATAGGQCPTEPTLQNWAGAGSVVCPCFVAGEEAAAILDAPASHYPIEILRIQIGWGSQFGGAPQSLEQNLHIYSGTLPNPGAAQFSLPAPVLSDGFINEFIIEFTPGNKIINSGPFMVSLEFANANAGMIFSPSVVHDGTGCQPGKSAVKAIPGGWSDSCSLGLTGQWVIGVVYRKLVCCSTSATWSNYGTGHPGTFGIPLFTALDNPIIGGTHNLFLSNSSGAPSVALMFIGFAPTAIPGAWGSDLLVVPSTTFTFPLPAAGILLSGPIPADPNLCNVHAYLQVLEADAGASANLSATAGIDLLFGE
jgi:hypothetical protein